MTAAAPSTSVSQGAEGFNPAKWGDYPIPEWPVSVSELPRWCRGFSQEGTPEAQQGWPEEKSLEHGMTVTPTKWHQQFWVQHTNFVISHQLWALISFYYTSRVACCNLSLVFLSAEFWWGREVMWVFLSKGHQEWSYTLYHKASPSPQNDKGNFCFGIHHTLIYM